MACQFTQEQIRQEAHRLYGLLGSVSKPNGEKWTEEDCLSIAPLTLKINHLKKEKNAVILAHSYTVPELVYGVADFKGDSYELSLKAREAQADTVVFAGVWFMAETAKIINPQKRVLIPAGRAGCSLADAMTGEDLKKLKAQHPGVSVLCYINSVAAVKALSDACVTSGNVYDIAQKMPGEELIFVPDRLMAGNLAAQLELRGTPKKIIAAGGTCCVHDQYRPEDVERLRAEYPGIKVVAHPESALEVCRLCDYVGSTKGMSAYVAQTEAPYFGMLTEQGLVNRLEAEYPDKKFIWPFGTCSYMKRNTLENTLQALENPLPEQEVFVQPETAAEARRAIEKMFELAQ